MNILLVTMEMQVGGAETHIFELAKELKNKNNNVYVMSAGGKYADALEKLEIEHIYAPLKNKKPQNIIKSYNIIKNTIKDKHIEIVHAHARIPAFIASKVCKRLNVPLVTTVHGIYKVTPLLKILTNWGEKTLAVSEDIRNQVIDVYKIKEDNISVTVNGINTSIFCKGKNEKIRKELKLDNNKFHIVHVSRLDNMSSNVAEILMILASELDKKIKSGVQLIIVGSGNKYEELQKVAENYNNVIMTGLRTDVAEILKESDLFVGVSRAALEAMSAELPVILAGNIQYGQGYIGIFDESKLDIALNTNFCCRGCENVEKEKLLNDIIKIYNMPEEEKRRLGTYGREVVSANYSIEKMVSDAEKMYKEVLK